MKEFFAKHKQDIVFGLAIAGMVIVVVGVLLGLFLGAGRNTMKGERYSPQKEYALLDLGSTGCAPCKELKPIMESLSAEYENIDIQTFDITNTQEGAAIANYYNVSLMPTLLFLDKNGNEVDRVTGFRSKEQIKEIFAKLGWLE